MLKFSVIVPVYNSEKYIEKCILSLLEQNYSDFELILVNDCSSDNSLNICNKYAEQFDNILVLNQPVNKGVSAARNIGIESAKGQYVMFVDSDDFVAPNYFHTIDGLIEKNNIELISFGHFDYIIFDDKTIESHPSNMNYNISMSDQGHWKKLVLNSFFSSPWNKVFSREILLKYNIRFDINCVCYEDYLFNVEYCSYINTFLVIEKPLYYYRQFSNVNHINKRKWGKLFVISNKVAKASDLFIQIRANDEDISGIRRYTFKAFLVELEVSRQRGEFDRSLEYVINNNKFYDSVKSIRPCGKKLTLYKIVYLLQMKCFCKIILETLVN